MGYERDNGEAATCFRDDLQPSARTAKQPQSSLEPEPVFDQSTRGRERVCISFVTALLVFMAMTAPAAAQGGDGGGGAILGIVVWIAIGAGVARFMIRNRSPFQLQTTTSVSPEEALEDIERSLVVTGWQLASKRTGSATFRMDTKGSCLIALLLLLLWIIPGILYLAFRGRMMTIDVTAAPGSSGTGAIARLNGSNRGFGGQATAEGAMRALPGARLEALKS